jgi:RND family efflux transporter MFP subunit
MKSTKSSGYEDPERTDPGALPGEKTRIQQSPLFEQPDGNVIPISPNESRQLKALRSLSLEQEKEEEFPARAHTRTSKLPWILLVLVVAGGIVFVAPLRRVRDQIAAQTTTGPKAKAPRIEVVRFSGGTEQGLRAAGYVEARIPITVGNAAGGRVQSVLVTEGQAVKKNQIIAQIDDSQAQADYALAAAKLRDARRTVDRTRKLYRVEGATTVDLETAIGKADIARAEMRPIEQRIQQAKVRAPIDGTILEVLAHEGEVLVGNGGVVKMADLTKLIAQVDINEADLATLQIGQTAEILSEAFPGRPFEGVVKEFATQADRSKGTVAVSVHLHIPDGSLRPGMSVKVNFQKRAEDKAKIVLSKTVIDHDAVWVVSGDGTLTRQPITTVPVGPNTVEVTTGLKGGERVLSEIIPGLQSGQKIDLTP